MYGSRADGFAFVLHDNVDKTDAIGKPGKSIGYGGISNSIAFEFDTWWNPTNGDLFTDRKYTIGGSLPRNLLDFCYRKQLIWQMVLNMK